MVSKQKSRNVTVKIILGFLILFLPLLILLINVQYKSFDIDYFEEQYYENQVFIEFGVDNLMNETNVLLQYLKDGSGEIDSDFYTQLEKDHLVDVRGIYAKLISFRRFFFFGSLILLLFLLNLDKKIFFDNLGKYLMLGGALAIILVLLSLTLFINFGDSFIQFHEVFFDNDKWMLDPEHNLINMFPQKFFYDISVLIIRNTFIWSVLIMLLGVSVVFRKVIK